MRVICADIDADGVLLPDAGVILMRHGVCDVHAYAVIRALLPDAPATTVLALSEQVNEPSTPLPDILAALS